MINNKIYSENPSLYLKVFHFKICNATGGDSASVY